MFQQSGHDGSVSDAIYHLRLIQGIFHKEHEPHIQSFRVLWIISLMGKHFLSYWFPFLEE